MTLSKTNQHQKTRILASEPHHGSWWGLVAWHQLGTKREKGTDWTQVESDLRLTNFREPNLRQPNPTRNHKP